MNPHKFIASAIFLLSLFFLSNHSVAQFNIKTSSAKKIESGIDTVKITQEYRHSPLDLSVYSSAYERYLKQETFKYRNKIKFRSLLGITQTSFDNWAAGGTNSFSGRLWVKLTHTYTNEVSKFNLISNLESAYTMIVADERLTKSEDFLNLSTTPSWKIAPRWEVSGSLILKTQLTSSYKSPGDSILTSSFFAPAYITVSAGITYVAPKGNFKAMFAPLSGNATFVLIDELADQGLFGVDPGENIAAKFGCFARVEFNQSFFKKSTTFEINAESFWDYYNCPTLWFEARLTYKLTKIFGASLYVKTIYDESIKTPYINDFGENNYWQINQSFGFNLTFNFDSKANTTPVESIRRRR